jgi:hypothetical protein
MNFESKPTKKTKNSEIPQRLKHTPIDRINIRKGRKTDDGKFELSKNREEKNGPKGNLLAITKRTAMVLSGKPFREEGIKPGDREKQSENMHHSDPLKYFE